MPNAATITVPETLALLDGQFSSVARGVAEDRYVLWLGSGISFGRVDGLRQVIARVLEFLPSGAIGLYHPDWVVVQKTKAGEVNWIIETKGRVWEGTGAKDEAIRDWFERIAEATGTAWRYVRVNQVDFDSRKPAAVADL